MPKFRDIPQFVRGASYVIDVGWDYVEHGLARYQEDYGLDLDPPFQRAHVWTVEQQRAYVEHVLRGGWASKLILFNCKGWMGNDVVGPMVLVDGKQRLNAVRRFLSNNLTIFGGNYFKDYTDSLRSALVGFRFGINGLNTDREVLQWYLELNAGGTPHTQDELDKVRKMLENNNA